MDPKLGAMEYVRLARRDREEARQSWLNSYAHDCAELEDCLRTCEVRLSEAVAHAITVGAITTEAGITAAKSY